MATLVPQLIKTVAPVTEIHSSGRDVARARAAQAAFTSVTLKKRLAILTRARHLLASRSRELASAAVQAGNDGVQRSMPDVLVAEVLPLAEAIRFLEREAGAVLRPQKFGRHGRPFWLRGLASEIHRVPLGVVLLIGPSNYPLFLPAVQCAQALAAGNAVLWKPARGGSKAAYAFAGILSDAGLPDGLLQILDESPRAGVDAIRAGVDKVFVTGHADTGRAVMHELAEMRTPSVMELSGCDSVFVLDGADLERVISALAFGMRLNGSATCMAPRRVFATGETIKTLLAGLLPLLAQIERTPLAPHVRVLLEELLLDAQQRGGTIRREGRLAGTDRVSPIVVTNAHRESKILRTDVFAPLLTFCTVASEEEAIAVNADCPYALTVSIFGPEIEAQRLAEKVQAGTVLINDLIVGTADPRIPFGGRDGSGFGVTRGREGLLEMTAVKSILTQRSKSLRAYAHTTVKHEAFFAGYIAAAHSGSLAARLRGFKKLLTAARDVDK